MKNLSHQQQLEKIKSEFYLSNSLLVILFLVSFSGLLVGLLGWIHAPIFLWMIPDSYYIVITFMAFILLGFTLIGGALMRNLRISYAELKENS
jgi:hypothetical protein